MIAHDGMVIRYFVDLSKNEISMKIKKEEKVEELYFTGVLAHYFEHVMQGNCIGDIYDMDINTFIDANAKVLLEGKAFCWPFNFDTIDEIKKKIEINELKVFNIEGAYGFDGWIIAKGMNIIDIR